MTKEKGSVLILAMVAVLLLSIMLTGLLTVGTTEIYTTQNYQLHKAAYYAAVAGVEEIRNEIYKNPDPQVIENISKSSPETLEYDNYEVTRSYITGSLKDRESGTYSSVSQFTAFPAPPPPGISLKNAAPVMWRVNVTADVSVGKRNKKVAYAEILCGVYTLTEVSY